MSNMLKFAIVAAAVFSSTSGALALDQAREAQWQDDTSQAYAMPAAVYAQARAVPRQFGVMSDGVDGFRGSVTSGGRVIGQDPDANIRTQLQRESGSKAGE